MAVQREKPDHRVWSGMGDIGQGRVGRAAGLQFYKCSRHLCRATTRSDRNAPAQPRIPAEPLVDAKQAAVAHYGRLVLLAKDAPAGRRRIHSSLAGVGLSDRAARL